MFITRHALAYANGVTGVFDDLAAESVKAFEEANNDSSIARKDSGDNWGKKFASVREAFSLCLIVAT